MPDFSVLRVNKNNYSMDTTLIENLAQYGVLGLWTASLWWTNHQMKKEFQKRYDDINQNMLELIKKNQQLLETGLREMREKYADDRYRRMKDRT